MILALVNEHGQTVSLLQDTLGVLTDPAHVIAELVISIVFEILQFVAVYVIWKRWVKPRFMKQIHDEVDAEHGVTHEDEQTMTWKNTSGEAVTCFGKVVAPGDTVTVHRKAGLNDIMDNLGRW